MTLGASTLILILFNFLTLSLAVYTYFRVFLKPREDVRLSRGLQLLQSKIAVLEDLKDRTEHQSHQITHLLEIKMREIKSIMADAEKLMERIAGSQQKSLEVAQIFEEKIPHQEVIERQNSKKYIMAMQMYNSGKMPDEISEKTGLTRSEINLVIKVRSAQQNQIQAEEEVEFVSPQPPPVFANQQSYSQPTLSPQTIQKFIPNDLNEAFSASSRVRKVEFPRVEINQNLN